jgi:hypothetical protein
MFEIFVKPFIQAMIAMGYADPEILASYCQSNSCRCGSDQLR